MQKSILKAIPPFILIFLFFACSNSQDPQGIVIDYENTLRKQFQDRFDSISWTGELEPDLIAQRKDSDSKLFSSKSLNNLAAASVIAVTDSNAIYPSIAGFGSIDITLIPASLKSMITDFCAELLNISQTEAASWSEAASHGNLSQKEASQDQISEDIYSKLASHISSERRYMLSIYLQDTKTYPVASKFYLGRPVIVGKEYEVPVLFLSSQGSWIVILYAQLQDGEWKIEQIRYGDFVYE